MGLFTKESSTSDNGRRSADAFINLSIPAQTESGKTKLGNGVRLYLSRNTERELIEYFAQAKEAGKEAEFNTWLKEKLIIDMKLNNATGGAGLAVDGPDFL